MSTKTTFKRVALVTVAVMGFGLLSVVPSSATTQTDTLTVSAATSACAIAATDCTITVTQSMLAIAGDTMSVTARLSSNGNASSVAMPVLTDNLESRTGNYVAATGYPFVSTDSLTGLLTDTSTSSRTAYHTVAAAYTATFTPTHPGTFVVTFNAYNMDSGTARSTVVANAAAVTWTITVASGTVADSTSTSLRYKGIVASGSAADQSVVVAANTGSAVAVIVTTPLTASATSTGSTTTTAVLTGPGSLTIAGSQGAPAVSAGARTVTRTGTNTTGPSWIYVYGDGTTGTATITVTVGANTFTETVVFYGAAASVTSTLLVPVINSGSGAVSTGSVISATAKDAAGNVVPGVALFAVSSSGSSMASATATTGSTGVAYFSFKGLTAGTSAITVQNVAAGSTATFSAAALSVRAGSNIASSVTMTLDKATYAQGEAAVLTVTIKDAAGNNVANGTHDAFSVAPTASRTVAGEALPGTSVVTSGSHFGAVTYKINVPTTSGAFTISGLGGADLAAAQAELAISVTATVSQTAAEVANADAIAAAADAAAEATDAANAATDAANAAAEAADAATAAAQDAADAVSTLGTQVAELIDGLKAQIAAQKAAITALTNLVIKIQKKLKA